MKKITTLWKKAGKAMQDWYRAKPERCMSCGGRADVMHHHFHWSRSLALRLDERNLIPLCSRCHLAHHNGVMGVKISYEKEMRERWGANWEDTLLSVDRSWTKKSVPELRKYLQEQIQLYTATN